MDDGWACTHAQSPRGRATALKSHPRKQRTRDLQPAPIQRLAVGPALQDLAPVSCGHPCRRPGGAVATIAIASLHDLRSLLLPLCQLPTRPVPMHACLHTHTHTHTHTHKHTRTLHLCCNLRDPCNHHHCPFAWVHRCVPEVNPIQI